MQYGELIEFLENVGKDPSRLIFEDELTGIHNRRFLLSYLEHKVRWDSYDDFPLALLVIDLDQFKEVNDAHGHDTGDQVLIWMATTLQEIIGDQGMPIRFGGDEFAVLLPRTGQTRAREMAARILQRTRDRTFRLRDSGATLPITLSIGVASAPTDATSSRELFHAADSALYHAKQSGRDQAASASEVDPEKVFSKTALHRLSATGIVGREEEMAAVSQGLERLSTGQSHLIIFDAAPGMGKTTFLEAVRHNLVGDDSFWVSMVTGDPQEAYRPYYLISRILIALLNQRDDKGTEILQELPSEEATHLSHVLPQLRGSEALRSDRDIGAQRQGIFATLARFLPRIVDRPLVLLIDDLQLADEATLLLLRVLFQRQELKLLVCGSSLKSMSLGHSGDDAPLDRFCSAHEKELGIQRVELSALSEGGILEYLHSVFPILKTPEAFESDLARITQGNPLFLGEIIRKLVADRRVSLTGQEWVIEPLEAGYLPDSLEEIVLEKIAALDEEGRKLLEHASTLGDGISLSVLAGSSDLDENKVLEFLDRAEALGLISLDFNVNDEVMKFLGKQVMEISYGGIEKDRREELHEGIGAYQEKLYHRRLLPSASMLAYHFKRSTNQEKARLYEQIQLDFSQTVFDPDEAANYTGEILEEDVETEKRLESESIHHVASVLRALMSAVRNIKLYPPESKAITEALDQVKAPIDKILESNEQLHLSQAQRVLLVNGQRLDITGFKALADSFLELLTWSELQGMAFRLSVTGAELRALLMTLGDLKPELIDHGFWANFSLQNGLQNIELRQMRYSRVRRRKGRVPGRRIISEEDALGHEELVALPNVLRALQGAAKNVRLYPMDSAPVTHSIERLHTALQGVLGSRDTLSLSGVDRSLMVNGARVDISGFEAVAESLLSLLDSVGLRSLTFFANIPVSELVAFADALRDPAACTEDPDYWDKLAKENALSSLAFNQSQYAVNVVRDLLSSVEVELDEEATPGDAVAEWSRKIASDSSEALRDALPRFGKEFLVRGEHKLLNRLLRRSFDDFHNLDVRSREKAVLSSRVLLEGLILGLQHKLTQLALDTLLTALEREDEPRVLQELATVLYSMAACSVLFADYQMASRILLSIKARQRQLRDEKSGGDQSLARLLDRTFDTTAQKLLEDDLKSGQPERHGKAALVVSSLGQPGIPLLVEVIKTEKDFRTRQLAASLLTEIGRGAATELKRALVTEVVAEQRFRVLEVIDAVTQDLRDELAYSLGDSSAKIRRAAFRLFERLSNDSYIELILPLCRDDDLGVAKGAIRTLAHLKSVAAVDSLVSLLGETSDAAMAVACCQALGEVGHSAAIDGLAKVLAQRKFLLLTRRWNAEVRAAAAMALKQISHPRATETLSQYASDRAIRVRQLAETAAPAQTR